MRYQDPHEVKGFEPSLLRTRRALPVCALVGFLAATVTPATAEIVRGPFLQIVSPTFVTITWRTGLDSAPDSKVDYGTAATALTVTATGRAHVPVSNPNVLDHVVTIRHLTPDTHYYYDVGTVTGGIEGGGTADYAFQTSPRPGSRAPVRAWIIGDSGRVHPGQTAVRNAMLEETKGAPPPLFITLGDIAYDDGTDAQLTNAFFTPFRMILRRAALWTTPGNHELHSANSVTQLGPYYDAFILPRRAQAGGVASDTEAYYSFDYANAHFVSLDPAGSALEPGSPMLAWLAADLAANTREWTITFFHHPPYTKGSHDSDDAGDSDGRMVRMRENVVPLLEAGGVDLAIGGHSHCYERSYLIDGAYGFGNAPAFATPDLATLRSSGAILDDGDGDPSGAGPYRKPSGNIPHAGTVYVVAGHAGSHTELAGLHPVMLRASTEWGSGLLDIDAEVLRFRNLLSDGTVGDTFSIVKESATSTTSTTLAEGTCGNGIVEGAEECDDGDTSWMPGESCGADCVDVACGDVDDSSDLTAADALFVLRAALDLQTCAACVCDLDGGAGSAITAADALMLLRAVLDGSSPSTCPACPT